MTTEHVEGVDQHLENFVAAEASEGMSAQALQLFNICNVYQKAKPVLKLARALLFWKPKWQAVIDELESVADGICPAA